MPYVPRSRRRKASCARGEPMMLNSTRSRTSGMQRSTAFHRTSARSSLYASYSSLPGVSFSHGSYGSPPDEYTWMQCLPSGHTEGSTSDGMKKEQRFCESCSDLSQSCTTRCAGSLMCERSRSLASMAMKRCMIAPWRGSLPSVFFHSTASGGSSLSGPPSILTVSKGVALDTTAFFALMILPFLSCTPTARPFSVRICATCAFICSLPPNFSSPRTIVLAICSVPPMGTQ
mmetsp:Transcript_75299/g.182003  ORF Transcript_75299/g.182003 Transcript_75299/m.182003 type:complete len:231 (-) Transcript_75299:971-1663(-)